MTLSNPITGSSVSATGRTFIGGRTLVAPGQGQSEGQLERWVRWDESAGAIVAVEGREDEAQGFPGLGQQNANLRRLVSNNTILFVVDSDENLSSFEAFPPGLQVRFRVSTALESVAGETLENQVLAASTVGADGLSPEIIVTPAPAEAPLISPGDGDTEVDPTTTVRFEFTEPIQPYSLGPIGSIPATDGEDDGAIGETAGISTAATMVFGEVPFTTTVPFTVLPASPFDLSTLVATPAFPFPGRGPEFGDCGVFSKVDIAINTQQIEDLSLNFNQNPASTTFFTGEGIGVSNVPVLPEAVYVGRGGAIPGLSAVDLNGFGQSTGNPSRSADFPREGESRFTFDPNVSLNPLIRPLLRPGECTIDGGSAGLFTLTLDSGLSDLLLRAPLVSQVTDMHVGHSLDSTFRNAPGTGCQVEGGYVCATDGFKVVAPVFNNQPNTLTPALQQQVGSQNPGYENLVSWAPHPNPPTIRFPPLCVFPLLPSAEPTEVQTNPADQTPGLTNLLIAGNPFPIPATGTPPTGVINPEQAQWFLGPLQGQQDGSTCVPYQMRQQVGQYLYIADRPRSEIVVINSNRMTVLERIEVPDPTSLAMGPNLDLIAVTNQLADSVTFIDINPESTQFHKVVRTVRVGNSPRGIAFDGLNEDILVCNELDSSMSIISASGLAVRRTISSQLNRPFELAVTPRMLGFASNRQVYFAYILNRSGNVALFESGPNGLNGWGFDDVIGIIPFDFLAPKAIQLDPVRLLAAVVIVHEGPIDVATGIAGDLGNGAISRLQIESGPNGAVPIGVTNTVNPNFRDSQFAVTQSMSQTEGQLSGIPLDIAFDNLRNISGSAQNQGINQFSAGSSIPGNNKCQVRIGGAGINFVTNGTNSNEPLFLFASVPNPIGGEGVIDVINFESTGAPRFDTNPYEVGIQSIPAPLVTILGEFFRQ